jgi:nitroreductase
MTPVTPCTLLDALQWRYATKQFQPGSTIPDDVWTALEDSLVLTPSSFGLQPWKFLVVDDPSLRAELQAVSWNQPQTTEASRFVVFTVRTGLEAADIDRWMSCLSEIQGKSADDLAPLKGMISGFTGRMSPEMILTWNTRQAYIALGQFMAAAALLGVDTCPMEGIDAASYDRILGLNGSGYTTVVACAAGYRNPADKYASAPKARFSKDHVVRYI